MDFFEFLLPPTIIFLVIVAPVWIALHYRSLNRSSQSLNAEDRENLEQILITVDKLSERIVTLESLLDAEHEDWRSDAAKVKEQPDAKQPVKGSQ